MSQFTEKYFKKFILKIAHIFEMLKITNDQLLLKALKPVIGVNKIKFFGNISVETDFLKVRV